MLEPFSAPAMSYKFKAQPFADQLMIFLKAFNATLEEDLGKYVEAVDGEGDKRNETIADSSKNWGRHAEILIS